MAKQGVLREMVLDCVEDITGFRQMTDRSERRIAELEEELTWPYRHERGTAEVAYEELMAVAKEMHRAIMAIQPMPDTFLNRRVIDAAKDFERLTPYDKHWADHVAVCGAIPPDVRKRAIDAVMKTDASRHYVGCTPDVIGRAVGEHVDAIAPAIIDAMKETDLRTGDLIPIERNDGVPPGEFWVRVGGLVRRFRMIDDGVAEINEILFAEQIAQDQKDTGGAPEIVSTVRNALGECFTFLSMSRASSPDHLAYVEGVLKRYDEAYPTPHPNGSSSGDIGAIDRAGETQDDTDRDRDCGIGDLRRNSVPVEGAGVANSSPTDAAAEGEPTADDTYFYLQRQIDTLNKQIADLERWRDGVKAYMLADSRDAKQARKAIRKLRTRISALESRKAEVPDVVTDAMVEAYWGALYTSRLPKEHTVTREKIRGGIAAALAEMKKGEG